MTNRQVLMTAIMIMAISMSIAGTEDVFASHGGGPDDHSCDRNVDPEITGITPTIDGAILEWIQDPTRTGRGGHHVCDTPVDEFEIQTSGNPSFSSTVSGTTFTETITGLECDTEYEVELTTDWDNRFQRDTSTSAEFETLSCEPEEEPEVDPEGCSRQYEDPVIQSIVPTIDGAVVTWTQEQKKVFFWCFDPLEFTVTSGSFTEFHISGDTSGTATITGLECGTNYDVEVSTNWIFHSDTTDSDEYTTLACEEDETSGGGDDRHKTSPTSGNDWNTLESIVEGGITVDGETFTITDNWYTPFDQIQIETGSTHSFGVKTFAQNGGLMVQEIAFGITAIGDYVNAEAMVEVYYDWDKTILDVIVVQDTEVIDVSTLQVSTDQVLCRSDSSAICYQTDFDLKFNEPLKDKVYAVKAFDMQRRTMMPHYFNDGISVFGDSLNPMLTKQIASTERYEGLITITQIEKYSNLWVTEDGRIFDSDNLYTQTNKVIQKGYNDARGSPVQQMNLDGQAYLASQLYFDSSKIQGTDGGFIAAIVDTDGDSREKTLQQLVSYNAN